MTQLIMSFDVTSLVGNLVDNFHKGHKKTVKTTTKIVTEIVEKMLPKGRSDTDILKQTYKECLNCINEYKNKHKKLSEDCLGTLKLDEDKIQYTNDISQVRIYFTIGNGGPWISYHEYPYPPYSVDIDEDDLTSWIKIEINDAKKIKAQRSLNF